MHAYRTHNCAALTREQAGSDVRLSGWVHRIRDHGGVLFIDLRDHYGITQVIADGDSPAFAALEKVRAEWVIRVDGRVKARDAALVNKNIPTGEIEVYATGLEVLGPADDLPMPVFGDIDYPEETRLTYRFLDLRREKLHANMMLRSNVVRSIRNRMWDAGFNEFQTPIITASSPEGARISGAVALHPGKFYALPQAPQQFKQLLMVAGFDRYFQIAPCFRDEDPRADRSPTDFYQLDLEMSFVDPGRCLCRRAAGDCRHFRGIRAGGRKVDRDWPRIAWRDSLYGTAPTSRTCATRSRCRWSASISKVRALRSSRRSWNSEGTEIRAIPASGGGSRKFCDRMNAFAQKEGLPGMGYILWRQAEDGSRMEAAGPLAKNIGAERTEAIRLQLGLGVGDAAVLPGREARRHFRPSPARRASKSATNWG